MKIQIAPGSSLPLPCFCIVILDSTMFANFDKSWAYNEFYFYGTIFMPNVLDLLNGLLIPSVQDDLLMLPWDRRYYRCALQSILHSCPCVMPVFPELHLCLWVAFQLRSVAPRHGHRTIGKNRRRFTHIQRHTEMAACSGYGCLFALDYLRQVWVLRSPHLWQPGSGYRLWKHFTCRKKGCLYG